MTAEDEQKVYEPRVRVRIDFAYDGGPFAGWAKQPGLVTVQGVLEEALSFIFRHPIFTTVAGRTDAGVHALHQVAHFDVTKGSWEQLPGRSQDAPAVALRRKLRGALSRALADAEAQLGVPSRLQGYLQGAITVSACQEVPADFNARFSALERSYRYLIEDNQVEQGSNPLNRLMAWQVNSLLSLNLMNRAARQLLGLHDFLSFCKPRAGSTTIRELRELSFTRREDGLIEAHIRADAFCHNMVRTLIASLVMVGEGKKDEAWLLSRIAEPVRDSQVRLAAPRGLALETITYPPASAYKAQSEKARNLRSL
ncbi:tRNA pseudouridine(38,39,40) synthase TruA [Rothia nasimurium]|uniref:tRNA pseudouridine synthase A n=1 Tax=Rothia nasimurium TaxID=85336 RepID=A0A1Y1RT60_9MICC|nr:tRNA pseudouridine(38-40) synthase TruA [Rothia nasimurium]ORC24425.1 tRNA pseudouridine(38,39,40) synthase TruA [Rothia nasimurium]